MRHRLPRARLVLPVVLIVTGIATLAGCIYIPWPKSPVDPKLVDPTSVLGERSSNKPLAVGRVTREAVFQILGPPQRQSPDGRTVGYVIRRKGGLWFSLVCAYRAESDLAVRLEFDDGGLLARYTFLERDAMQYLFPGSYVPVWNREVEKFMDDIGPGVRDYLERPSTPDPKPIPAGSRYETRRP